MAAHLQLPCTRLRSSWRSLRPTAQQA